MDKTVNHMTYFTVEAEESDLEVYIDKVYQQLVKRTEIPEFDKKDVTRGALVNHIGKDKMLEDVINEMTQEAYSQAIIDYKIESDMQPMIKIIQKNPPILEMIIPLKPIVKLCDYHSLKTEFESLDITDEEVNIVLEGLRKQYAKLSPTERPVIEGDGVIIDLKGEISGISFINKQGIKFMVTPEYSGELPGLYKELVGMAKGEEKEFRMRFPESYTRKEAAGKDADYKVKVIEILEQLLPELNNELADRIAPGVKTLEALNDRIRKNMSKEREGNFKLRFENKLMDTLIRGSKIEYPPVMLDAHINRLIAQYRQEIISSYTSDMDYKEKINETPENLLRERARPIAEKRVLWSLIINEAAKEEGIEVSDSEVNEEILRMLNEVEDDEREGFWVYFNEYQNRQDVKDIIKARKTINRLTEIVRTWNSKV
jgi:trigger factor